MILLHFLKKFLIHWAKCRLSDNRGDRVLEMNFCNNIKGFALIDLGSRLFGKLISLHQNLITDFISLLNFWVNDIDRLSLQMVGDVHKFIVEIDQVHRLGKNLALISS